MKFINKAILFLFCGLMLCVCYSCEEEDSAPAPVQPKEKLPAVKLTESAINVAVGTTVNVNIKEGGTGYKVFSSNEDVSTATVENNVITVTGKARGKASIIISDENSQLAELAVTSYYTEIAMQQDQINFMLRIGNSETKKFPIVKGNLGYEVTSESEKVVASIDGEYLVLSASEEVTTNVTIKDAHGLSLTIPVVVKTTTIAFDDDQKAEIMQDNTPRCYYLNNNTLQSYYTPVNKVEDEKNVLGWDYWNWRWYKLRFVGGLTVGEKSEGVFDESLEGGSSYANTYDATIEVIKNDGSNIWIIWSFVKDDVLIYGHICQAL